LDRGKNAHRKELGVDKEGICIYVDLSVVSTLCGSYRNIGAKKSGAAGVSSGNEKLRKHSEQVEIIAFERLVVESIGGWNLERKLPRE
jgi:hypothetical protein